MLLTHEQILLCSNMPTTNGKHQYDCLLPHTFWQPLGSMPLPAQQRLMHTRRMAHTYQCPGAQLMSKPRFDFSHTCGVSASLECSPRHLPQAAELSVARR